MMKERHGIHTRSLTIQRFESTDYLQSQKKRQPSFRSLVLWLTLLPIAGWSYKSTSEVFLVSASYQSIMCNNFRFKYFHHTACDSSE